MYGRFLGIYGRYKSGAVIGLFHILPEIITYIHDNYSNFIVKNTRLNRALHMSVHELTEHAPHRFAATRFFRKKATLICVELKLIINESKRDISKQI